MGHLFLGHPAREYLANGKIKEIKFAVDNWANQEAMECGMGYVKHHNGILHNSPQAQQNIVEGRMTQSGHITLRGPRLYQEMLYTSWHTSQWTIS